MTATVQTTSLWRDRNYMCFRTSRFVSMLGTRISGIAGPLLVLSISGSEGPVRAGLVGSAMLVARMVFQLPGGQWADRFDQRRLMLAMDAVRMVVVGSIPLAAMFSQLTFPHLLLVATIEGAASAVFSSAAMVFLRVATPPEQFAQAMSQSQASLGITSLIGPIIGGALYAVDPVLPFTVDAATYVVSGALLLAVSVPADRSNGDALGAVDQADRRVTAGLRWLLHHKGIMRITVFCSVLNLVGAASGVAAVVVLSESGTSSAVIGVVLACSGAGVFAGSLVSTRAVVLGPTRLFLACGLLWSGSLAALTVSSSAWVVGGVLTFLAVLGPSTGVMFFQILRDESPERLYGRVISAQQLLGTGLATAGPVLAGLLIAAFGSTYLWLALGLICLATTVLIIRPFSAAGSETDEAPPVTIAQGAE